MSATKQLFEQMREESPFSNEDMDIMYQDWLRSQELEKIQAELEQSNEFSC